jgi:hypothetical protein
MRYALILLISLMISGCAASYKPIQPENLVFSSTENSAGVKFGYRYEVLSFRGNRKSAKKESKKHIRVVALKIENNSTKTLKLGENLNLYSGDNNIYPMQPETVFTQLRQTVPVYLLYALVVLNKTECDGMTGNCNTSLIFPIGVPIALANMIVAGSANKHFLTELNQYNIVNKEIAPGAVVYALIGIPDTGFQPLKVEIK